MPSFVPLLRGLLCGSKAAAAAGNTVITRPGMFDATPDVTLSVIAPGPKVVVALTGPDKGVSSLLQQQPQLGADVPWTHNQPHQEALQQHTSCQQDSTVAAQPQQQSQHHSPQHSNSHHRQQQQQQQQQHNSVHNKTWPQQSPTSSPRAHYQQQQHQQHTWGCAISLYDMDPLTGCRNGDPIADCFAAIAYPQGAIMALADGVNWGERPKQAARGAVLGFCGSLHRQLAYAQGGRKLSTPAAFAALRAGVLAAQQQVLLADGTLTTLVGAVVCPKRWGGGSVLLAVGVGDSPCYVWRAATGVVEEVTYLPPLHGFHRDPRVCPGCLGYAVGDQPDLSNITYSVTQLQQGDLVLLASDGIADNFDPVMRKQALASSLPSKSPRATAAAQAAAHSALSDQPDLSSHLFDEMCPASPATCHARAMNDMAMVLRSACGNSSGRGSGSSRDSSRHQQQQQQQHMAGQQQQQERTVACAGAPQGSPAAPGSQGSQDPARNSNGSSGGGSGKLTLGAAAVPPCRSGSGELPAFAAGTQLSPRAAVEALLSFVTSVTAAQRRVLEQGASDSSRRQQLGDELAGLPGKLDHASVVAYRVAC